MSTTAERVKEIIVDHLGVDAKEITPTTNLVEDLAADSLDRIEMMMALEQEFGIAISDPEAERVTTVREVEALVDVKLAEQQGARA